MFYPLNSKNVSAIDIIKSKLDENVLTMKSEFTFAVLKGKISL